MHSIFDWKMELCRDLPAGMLYQLIENWEKLTADISEVCMLKLEYTHMYACREF